MNKVLLPNITPRGLSLKQVAAYWGVSQNTYRKFIREGIAPPPIRLGRKGKMIFDRIAQDAALDAHGKRGGGVT